MLPWHHFCVGIAKVFRNSVLNDAQYADVAETTDTDQIADTDKRSDTEWATDIH